LNEQLTKAIRNFDRDQTKEPWCDVSFRKNEFPGPWYQNACYARESVSKMGKANSANYTAGYLFVAPKLMDDGRFGSPRLLGLFGLGGCETLTLARLLAKSKSLAPTLREFIHSPSPRILIIQWPVPTPPAHAVPGVVTLPLRPSSIEFLKKISPKR